jgi:brevican
MTKLTADWMLWLGYAGLLSSGAAGCFSLEPLDSYAQGELSSVASADAPLELQAEAAEPPATPGPEADAGAPTPGDGGAEFSEGDESVLEPAALGFEPSDVAAASCTAPGEFLDASGLHCYWRGEPALGWTAAQQSCRSWGGQLVSIDSREEDDFLAEQLQVNFWTGANDRLAEGRMRNSAGLPLVFTNWNSGQPDDSQGREDCVVKRETTGGWNDLPCNSALAYVCERDDG